MFSHPYRYIFITCLAVYTFLNTILCDVYYHFGITIAWYYALGTIFFVTLLTWEGNRLMERWVEQRVEPGVRRWKFVFCFFASGAVIGFAAAMLSVFVAGMVVHRYGWEDIKNPLKLNIIYAGLINLFFHLLNTINLLFNEYKNKREEAEVLRATTEQAQIQLLKNQINPHFLFNNLNVLSSMVIRDNPEANHFIEEFSKVYRYIINNQDKELVSLKTELEFVEPYLFLLKKRFTDGLSVSIDIPEKYKQFQVVPAAVQMLVENAIKHNVVSSSKRLHISIHGNGNNVLIVSNNIQPRKTVEDSRKIGLANIKQRYQIISGRNVEVFKTSECFQVHLPLLEVN